MTRHGDPDILALFDAWWSTPLAYKDPEVDPSKWDAVADETGTPLVIAVREYDLIGDTLDQIEKYSAGITIAVATEDRGELIVAKLVPDHGDGTMLSQLARGFEWRAVVDNTGHPKLRWETPTGRYRLVVSWPLGEVDDGDLNRVAI